MTQVILIQSSSPRRKPAVIRSWATAVIQFSGVIALARELVLVPPALIRPGLINLRICKSSFLSASCYAPAVCREIEDDRHGARSRIRMAHQWRLARRKQVS